MEVLNLGFQIQRYKDTLYVREGGTGGLNQAVVVFQEKIRSVVRHSDVF